MKPGLRRTKRSYDFAPRGAVNSSRVHAFVCAGLAAILIAAPACAAVPAHAAPAGGRWRDASLEDYRKHLVTLTSLVEACAKTRDLKTCDPMLVGPDDRIPLSSGANAERRLVRYGWLRVLFSKAEEQDAPKTKPNPGNQAETQPAPLTTSQMLLDAEKRLESDLARASDSSLTISTQKPVHAQERAAMQQILAGRDFSNLGAPSMREAAMEKLGTWLNRLYQSAVRIQARSPWVGQIVEWGFVLAVCVGLAWGLLQLERRWRVRLSPEASGPAAGAVSARDWQLWLHDARAAAAGGKWREAVHFLYWAAIARLEARRLWPADRARTPREYLALLAPEDPRRAGLAKLTASFERVWYGGRPAGEGEYQRAERLAIALIAGGALPDGDVTEGGAR